MTELGPALVACLLVVSVGAALLRRVGPSLGCLVLASALVLALTQPEGLAALEVVVLAGAPLVAVLDRDRDRGWVTLVVCGALTAATALAAVATDPFRDPACLVGCTSNPLALGHFGAAPVVAEAFLGIAALATASRGVRRRSVLMVVSAALAVAAVLGILPLGWALIAAACIGLVRGAAEIWLVVEARGRLADLAMALEQSQDPVASLRRQLDDPELSVDFVLPDGTVVDQDGGPAPEARPDGRVDLITLGESTLARVNHGAVTSPGASAMSGGARVALDNARLVAVSRRNARLLRESRSRVVSSSEEERRLLERDLHDGAQQEVLSLGLALRDDLATATATTQRHALEGAVDRIPVVLESLRELGHGLRPAGMDGGSLSIALEAISDRSRVPVDIAVLPQKPIASWAVSAIAGLVARQTSVAENPVNVQVSVEGQRVITVITGGTGPPPRVEADRFATLGGALTSDRSTVRAWLPTGAE